MQGPYGDYGELNLGRNSASSSGGVGYSPAHINVMGQQDMGNVMGSGHHPLMAEVLKSSKVQRFTGKCEDFEDFERRWTLYLKLLQEGSPRPIPHAHILMLLKGYLDKASAARLEARMYAEPNLSYLRFWEELRSQFRRDVQVTHRQNWQKVQVRIVGKRLTLQEWAEFQALYVGKRALVDDWAETEDRSLVFRQIPKEYHKEIMSESATRRNGQFWLRISIPNGCEGATVRDELEFELGKKLRQVAADKRQLVMACDNLADQKALLEFDNADLDGKIIRVQRAEYHMTGDDLLEYVRGLLEQEDDLRLLRSSYGGSSYDEENSRESPRGWEHERGRPRGAVYLAKGDEDLRRSRSNTREERNSPAHSEEAPRNRWQENSHRRSQSYAREAYPRDAKGKGEKGKGEFSASKKGKGETVKEPQGQRTNTVSPSSLVCRHCKTAGKPSDHNYYTCEYSKKIRQERWQQKKKEEEEARKNSPQRPTSPRDQAQSSSSQKGKGEGKAKGKKSQ